MTNPLERSALRVEFKRKLAAGTYDPLAERLIKWVRCRFPRLPKGDLAPFLILSLGHFLLICPLYLLDGVSAFRNWAVTSFLFSILIWAGIFLYARLYRQLYRVLSGSVIDALTQSRDLQGLKRYLSWFSHPPLTVFVIALYVALIMPYVSSLLVPNYGAFQAGAILASISGHLINGIVMHHLIFLMAFPLLLSRFQIDLYELDPGASPAIHQLSTVIRTSAYQLSLYATVFTLFLVYILRISVFPLAFVYLLPLLGIFIFRQIGLSLIVGRARWLVLERLSARLEQLDLEHHFDNPAIYNQYKAIQDYYNRVKHAETGVFDARTGTLLFTSFLLPLIAFVLFQFDRLVAFIGRFIH